MGNKNIIYIAGAAVLAFLGWKWYTNSQSSSAASTAAPSTTLPDNSSPAPKQAVMPSSSAGTVATPEPAAQPATASAYPSGLTENELIKGSTPSIYILNSGSKWTLTWAQYVAMGQPSFNVVDDSVISSIPTGAGIYWTGSTSVNASGKENHAENFYKR